MKKRLLFRKPFECPVCKRTFITKTKTGDIICPYCGVEGEL
jgi:DNA-directed RNA polymerase subunit RPC12/RpoP